MSGCEGTARGARRSRWVGRAAREPSATSYIGPVPDLLLLCLVAAGVFMLSALAQSVSGFGGAMVAIPLLLLVTDPADAIAAATGLSLVMSAWGWRREREYVDAPLARRLALAGLLGLPLGLVTLLMVDEVLLTRAIGVVVLLAVVLTAMQLRVPATPTAQRASGVLSGALLTSTGMNGPPLVLVMLGAGHPPRRMRATLQAVFTVQDVAAVGLFMLAGVAGWQVLLLVAVGCLAMPLGWALGDRVFHRLSEQTFRRLVLAGLVAVAVTALAQAG